MKLDCVEAQKRIQPYLQRSLEDHECAQFLEHVRHCPVCREELETAYLVEHALQFLDEDGRDSFDVKHFVDEDIASAERMLITRRIIGVLIWIGIIFMTVLIAAIALRYLAPGVFRGIGDLILRALHIDTDYSLWELIRLRITGSL